MSETILLSVVHTILMKMASDVLHDVAQSWSAEEEILRLKDSISSIVDQLVDVEAQQDKGYHVKKWLEELSQATYDVDDLIDDFLTRAAPKHTSNREADTMFVKEGCNLISCLHSLPFRRKLAREIRTLRKNLIKVKQDGTQLGFNGRPLRKSAFVLPEVGTMPNVELDYGVIGRDDDKETLMEMLMFPDSDEAISVSSITGVRGIGKTTLAYQVYNAGRITRYFDLKVWVCVADEFDVKLTLEKILKCVTGDNRRANIAIELLQRQLHAELCKKRYLLVLDGICDENRQKWIVLRNALSCGRIGSKILLTTRSKVVASFTSTDVYELKGMSDDDAWSLFETIAIHPGEACKTDRLRDIGMDIVEKCQCLPLAIKAAAGLLRSIDSEWDWVAFGKSLSSITEYSNDVFGVLRLCYSYLPSQLKQCFAYCALFPKDHIMNRQQLVRLWVAEGFIIPRADGKTLEEIGDEYFMQLLSMSFFQHMPMDQCFTILSYRVHDAAHDLARYVSKGEIAVASYLTNGFGKGTHHVSFDDSFAYSMEIPQSLLKATQLRSFLLLKTYGLSMKLNESLCETLIYSFGRLRVLDLHSSGIEMVSSSISTLKHLRYLDLSDNPFLFLPRAITRLVNLQTVDLSHCHQLKELPRKTRKFRNLRCLYLVSCDALTHMPVGLDQLTSLQTLSHYVVHEGKRSGRLEELGDLNLRGDLTIISKTGSGLSNCVTRTRRLPKMQGILTGKKALESLRIFWKKEGYGAVDVVDDDAELLNCLQPPKQLRRLEIKFFNGQSLPSWAMDAESLPSLVEARISSCQFLRCLPPFDLLHHIKFLVLRIINVVEYIGTIGESGTSSAPSVFFPSLEQLILSDLPSLKGWFREGRTTFELSGQSGQNIKRHLLFPRLTKAEVINCPKLTWLPFCTNAKDLTLRGVEGKLVQQLMSSFHPEHHQSAYSDRVETSSFSLLSLIPSFRKRPSSLKSLKIQKIQGPVSLPEEALRNLGKLRLLEISGCVELSSLPAEGFCGLTSLRVLCVRSCNKLIGVSSALEQLVALEELVIEECDNLDLWDKKIGRPVWRSLKSLRSLKISNISTLKSLPKSICNVKRLQDLTLNKLSQFMEIPEAIASLESLKYLRIHDCPQLRTLPEKILGDQLRLEVGRCPAADRLSASGHKNWLDEPHSAEFYPTDYFGADFPETL